MQFTCCHVDGDEPSTCTLLVHHQIDREVLHEKLRLVLQRLLIQGVQHRVSGAIGGSAGSLCRALAKMGRHAAERALINFAIFGARKRHSIVLELDDRIRRLFAHVLDRVLVAEPVGAFNGVVHVPAPIVVTHVAERRADATLCRHRVAARREHFRHACGREPRLRQTERGPQAGPARSNDDHIVAVVNEFVIRHQEVPEATRRMAIDAATAATM